jgi:MFS transporter, DHA1 family, multidrug resistance protein
MELWKRNLYVLWSTEFLAALGMALVLPFLPFYVRELGVQDLQEVERWSGLIFAAPFITATFATPLWGWLGDRYGRRIMLIRAMIGFTLTTTLMAFAQNVEQFFILRLIQGGISGFIAATLAIVSTDTPREHMGYAMGVLQTSLITGAIIGPFAGGILADQLGYRNVFLVTGGFGLVAGFLVTFFVQEMKRVPEKSSSPSLLSNFRFVFSSPPLLAIFVTGIILQVAATVIQPILSLFVEMLWGVKENLATVAGGVFAVTGVASLISSPLWGKKGDRMGFQKTLTITLLGTGLTCAPQALVIRVYQLILLRFIHGLFIGGILPGLYTLTTRNVPEERRGGVMGITRSGLLIGGVVGPICGGYLAASWGMRPIFFFTAFLLIGMAIFAPRWMKEGTH